MDVTVRVSEAHRDKGTAGIGKGASCVMHHTQAPNDLQVFEVITLSRFQ